jgi:type IV pilus assembly protein PilA
MVVVAIVGILAVLSVYSVRKYVASAKTAEAQNSLGQIAKDAVVAFERDSMSGATLALKTTTSMSRKLCGTVSATVPATAASIAGKKYQSKVSEWNVDQPTNAGFYCLKFSMDAPQYYMYSYGLTGTGSNAGDSFAATAQGDLNGDGVLSLFQLNGTIAASMVVNTAPNMVVVRPEQ